MREEGDGLRRDEFSSTHLYGLERQDKCRFQVAVQRVGRRRPNSNVEFCKGVLYADLLQGLTTHFFLH